MDESKGFVSKSIIQHEASKKFSMADPSPKTVEIDLESLHSFKNHPFKVICDKNMAALTASIKENGIITPLIVRRSGSVYEIISGHRRAAAALDAGLETVPCTIVDYDDEEATLCMCDSNLQREKLFPSERAKYVYIKYNILAKRRAYGDGRSVRLIAKEFGMSPATVSRCLNLYDLGPHLMDYVDKKKLKEKLAIAKVYPMRKSTREKIYYSIHDHDTSFDEKCLDMILAADRKDILTQEMFDDIVSRYMGERDREKASKKTNGNAAPTIPAGAIMNYFPASYTGVQIEEKLLKLLEQNKDLLDTL